MIVYVNLMLSIRILSEGGGEEVERANKSVLTDTQVSLKALHRSFKSAKLRSSRGCGGTA